VQYVILHDSRMQSAAAVKDDPKHMALISALTRFAIQSRNRWNGDEMHTQHHTLGVYHPYTL
jgi:hypothetical protein